MLLLFLTSYVAPEILSLSCDILYYGFTNLCIILYISILLCVDFLYISNSDVCHRTYHELCMTVETLKICMISSYPFAHNEKP